MNTPQTLKNAELAMAEVQEVSLLLPSWQITALERAARERGLTAGQMLRRVIRDFIVPRGSDNEDNLRENAAPLW